MTRDVCVIANPAAGRGRGARALPAIREAFEAVGVSDLRVTSGPGDERTLARRALDDGRTTLVACGGDGTWSNVANAILEAGVDARLGLVAAGTGNDFAKTVGAPATDPVASARLAVGNTDVRVDVGRIEGRHFLNVTGFGFDIAVLEDVERIPLLQGSALYMASALRQILGYRGITIDIASAEARRDRARYLMLIVANARQFGGAFRIAPGASLEDGRLDAVAFRDAPALRRLKLLGAAARGTHRDLPEVSLERSAVFRLSFAEPPGYEVDGEYHRATGTELEVRCVPGALRVVASDGARPA